MAKKNKMTIWVLEVKDSKSKNWDYYYKYYYLEMAEEAVEKIKNEQPEIQTRIVEKIKKGGVNAERAKSYLKENEQIGCRYCNNCDFEFYVNAKNEKDAETIKHYC